MALIELTVSSKVLGMNRDLLVILPEDPQGLIGMDGKAAAVCPTLYLLHGMSDDHTIWLRRTNIERYATAKGIAVVMPAADLSYYTDLHWGEKYYEHITRELPAICRSLFPMLSPRREDTFVAGLSMGGYGALKCVLRASDVFSCGAGLSSVADIAESVQHRPLGTKGYWEDVFGPADQIKGSFNDLFAAADDHVKGQMPPVRLYMWCGTEDSLYPQNVKLKDHLQSLGMDLTWESSPGDHRWSCWDEKIQTVLDWLPIGKEE